MKEYVVAEELINGEPSGFYTVRVNTDVNPARFIAIDSFDTYEEAEALIRFLRNTDIFL